MTRAGSPGSTSRTTNTTSVAARTVTRNPAKRLSRKTIMPAALIAAGIASEQSPVLKRPPRRRAGLVPAFHAALVGRFARNAAQALGDHVDSTVPTGT